ncbi:MAG: glycosyltransferase family 2 protein [Deltaproteobacteria bacterium]|nr:glycosyltransferase family 2 protein [Deltaproteobacteria bacterium]
MISILIFTRDDEEWLSRCLRTLRDDPPAEPIEVIVFDNLSQDHTAALVRAWRGAQGERAGLLLPKQDTSFSRGNNLLLDAAAGELALFLNPDTECGGALLDAGAFTLRADPTIALAGPRLVFPDGTHQSNGWALPSPVQLLKEKLAGAPRELPTSGTGLTDVGWLMGCWLMGRTEQLRRLGGFDERYWFLATDLELCGRAHQLGRLVRLDEHVLLHRGHQSWPESRRRASHKATLQWLLRSLRPGRGVG